MSIAVSIVDDDPQIRNGLAALINNSVGYRCVSCHASAESALAEIPSIKPDVTLMDINLPGLNGVECVRRLKPQVPSNEIIMLTMFQNGEHIFNALAAGATGYMLKQSTLEELLAAIKEVHVGGSAMSGHIARKVVQSFQKVRPAAAESWGLSSRENQILDLLAKGFQYKEIAAELNLAYDTIHSHVRKIYEKLQVRSRTEAAMKFYGKM